MAKTLADMTAEERAQRRGMWCDFPDPDERTNLAIYVGDSLKHHGFCELIHEGQLGTLTPRHDLPRAWMPDGQPVDGSWEKSTAELPTKGYKGTFTQHYRRWVGEWEQVE